jgi:MFS family permease
MFLLNGIGFFMSSAPLTRLVEDIVCRQYYGDKLPEPLRDGRLPEKYCKVPEVQETVAQLFGMQSFFDGIPGLLLAIPYGVFADKVGRRKVLVLSMLGQLLAAFWILFVCRFSTHFQQEVDPHRI